MVRRFEALYERLVEGDGLPEYVLSSSGSPRTPRARQLPGS